MGMEFRTGTRPMIFKSPYPIPQQQHATRQLPAAQTSLEHAFDQIPGMLASMLVAFGRNGIRTIEDLAACATDDLLGWTERRGEEVTMHPGILGDMAVSRKQCGTIILH